MNCWALIPIKATQDSKSRLSGILDADQRQELVSTMLANVLDAARHARTISQIRLVGPTRAGLPDDIPLLGDPGLGLNPAVQSAFAEIADKGPDRVLILAADLPEVTSYELETLCVAPSDTIAIAPDRHETGTNAICLPLPAARDFSFAFGPDSFAKHKVEASRLGLNAEIVLSKGLERDIDEPSDLADARQVLGLTL